MFYGRKPQQKATRCTSSINKNSLRDGAMLIIIFMERKQLKVYYEKIYVYSISSSKIEKQTVRKIYW